VHADLVEKLAAMVVRVGACVGEVEQVLLHTGACWRRHEHLQALVHQHDAIAIAPPRTLRPKDCGAMSSFRRLADTKEPLPLQLAVCVEIVLRAFVRMGVLACVVP
jgi:hypothetical protein